MPKVMKKILYATDFSENAEKAFPHALKLAQQHHASLIMLHVFAIPTSWDYPHTEDAKEMERQAIREAEKALKALYARYAKGVEVHYMTKENSSVIKGILAIMKETAPDLLVLGTRGKSKWKEALFGSTTMALVKKSPVPVLAIPEKATVSNFKNVLYATDFYEEDIIALRQMMTILQPFAPRIMVAHVSTPKEYKGEEKMEWFKDMVKEIVDYEDMKFELLLSDDIYEELNQFINRYKFDLLVMFEKERRGIIDRLFHHDLVKVMEFHLDMPLLSFGEEYLQKPKRKAAGMESTPKNAG